MAAGNNVYSTRGLILQRRERAIELLVPANEPFFYQFLSLRDLITRRPRYALVGLCGLSKFLIGNIG